MRLTRIYVAAPLASGATLLLPEAPSQHLARVLRLQAGATLRLFNGRGGEFDASIESISRSGVVALVGSHHDIERESPLRVTLLQGIARGEKMDLILQKATELGVAAVAPVTTLRSSVRLDDSTAQRKLAHWQGVLAGACEQSGRNRIPALAAATHLAAAMATDQSQLRLLLEPEPTAATLKALLSACGAAPTGPSVCLLVGPEGGLDALEVQQAKLAGFLPCRLGPRVLRTETAALAALAALQSLAGDLG